MDALPATVPPQGPRGAACVHRGQPTGETVRCPECRGKVLLKLFACAVHGRCTAARPAGGTACCVTCHDYAPPGGEAAPRPAG